MVVGFFSVKESNVFIFSKLLFNGVFIYKFVIVSVVGMGLVF